MLFSLNWCTSIEMQKIQEMSGDKIRVFTNRLTVKMEIYLPAVPDK